MKFSILSALSVLAAASTAAALPADASDASSLRTQGAESVRWPVPDSVTVAEGSAKCGNQAQLSCCNKAKYVGDTTEIADGLGAGLLSDLIGAGSGSEGLGVFDQCSKLSADVTVLLLLGVNDALNQQCKQNIACCAKSGADANHDLIGAGLPCVALGSIL